MFVAIRSIHLTSLSALFNQIMHMKCTITHHDGLIMYVELRLKKSLNCFKSLALLKPEHTAGKASLSRIEPSFFRRPSEGLR